MLRVEGASGRDIAAFEFDRARVSLNNHALATPQQRMTAKAEANHRGSEKVSGTVIVFLGTPLGTKRTFEAQATHGLL
jgi:hypothetical protein